PRASGGTRTYVSRLPWEARHYAGEDRVPNDSQKGHARLALLGPAPDQDRIAYKHRVGVLRGSEANARPRPGLQVQGAQRRDHFRDQRHARGTSSPSGGDERGASDRRRASIQGSGQASAPLRRLHRNTESLSRPDGLRVRRFAVGFALLALRRYSEHQ